eukprot:TRINITY_DN4174_c0_g1_i1.p1 TRINITY_DN4174_c0_g1~~TRINITY_DN4174_c0_g1_i1.p1  ORF type:complete len:486 (+),score=85.89 TRINITY_DN4174_c0_g1_i1:43-1500(+)
MDDSFELPSKSEGRKLQFKRGLGASELTDRRRESGLAARKEQRERLFSSKRRKESASAAVLALDPVQLQQQLVAIMAALNGDPDQRLGSLRALRDILATEAPPIEAAIQLNVVPLLTQLMQIPNADIQLESAWCLTNLAAGSEGQAATLLVCAPYLIQYVSSSNEALQEQGAWALANLAGDSTANAAHVIANGAVAPLTRLLESSNVNLQRVGAYALANLQRGQSPHHLINAGALPLLVSLLSAPVFDVACEAAWVLPFMSATEHVQFRYVMLKHGVHHAMLRLLQGPPELVLPALRTIGNFVSGSNDFTDACIQDGTLLPALGRFLLQEEKRGIQKESAYVLSNICGGTPEHVDLVVQAGLVPVCAQVLLTAAYHVKYELAFCFANIVQDGRYAALVAATAGVMQSFVELLSKPDPDLVLLCLQVVAIVLQFVSNAAVAFESIGGKNQLELLTDSPVDEIRKASDDLLEKYYYLEDDEEPPSFN